LPPTKVFPTSRIWPIDQLVKEQPAKQPNQPGLPRSSGTSRYCIDAL